MRQFKSLYLTMLVLGGLCLNSAYASDTLHSLTDSEMSATTGQSLFTLQYLAPGDTGNSYNNTNGNLGFYKFGMEAELELNANIKNLQLGCGGINGADGCDIDIKNLSLSGLNDGEVAGGNDKGSPTFSGNGRPSTSAKLTNPFIEFAIKNPNSASTREVAGFRLSAESISGLLSAGLTNDATPSTTDGIQSLSGYLQLAPLVGQVTTAATTFGKAGDVNCAAIVGQANGSCQAIAGKVNIALFGGKNIVSMIGDSDNKGVSVPSMVVPFSKSGVSVVTGSRMNAALVQNIGVTMPSVPLDCARSDRASASACGNLAISNFVNQLKVDLLNYNGNPPVGTSYTPNGANGGVICLFGSCAVEDAKFQMGSGSTLDGLKLNVTFKQSLSMFHNIRLVGTGGYLSLQGQDLHWPGANSDDIAKKGWWISFAEPVDLGYLTPPSTQQVNINDVLPQVAGFVSQAIFAGNDIPVDFGSALGSLTGNPIVKKLNINVSSQTANITLNDLQLTSQKPAQNCYGTLKFC